MGRPYSLAQDSPLTPIITLAELGWTNRFVSQCDVDELESLTPARLSGVQRATVTGLTLDGPVDLTLDPGTSTGEMAVGDWVLADLARARVIRRLDRHSILQRGKEHLTGDRQLIAANLDTLFITTSCNADFNPARLERYMALALDADITPVILLTKSDMTDDPDSFIVQAQALGRDLAVIALNAKGGDVADILGAWCGTGQTVALAGTSGVGKTTIANALTGNTFATQAIREDDARGRHTTTDRSLHRIPGGGWLIDTPGMRGLGVADVAAGIAATFSEITDLEGQCKFRNCEHDSEPGCAVQSAIAAGDIDPDRLRRFKKLQREDQHATETIAQARDRYRKLGKVYRTATKRKRP